MKMFNRHLLQLCLSLVGLCFALLLAEGFVRVFFPYARDHVVPSGFFEIDDYLGWKLTEGKSVTHRSRYFDATYRVNAFGYRDRLRNLSKDAKIYRILLYGDSQIFGWGVPAEQRFSNLIEAQKPHLEIWNMAVTGYGLDQEVLSYEKQGQLLNADEVIFYVSRTTLSRTLYDYIYKKNKPKFVIEQNGNLRLVPIQQETNVWTRLFYSVLSPLYLPYFVERRLAILKQAPKQAGVTPSQKTKMANDVISELNKKILYRARDLAHERKHRMTVITNSPKTSCKNMNLKDFCEQNDINFLQIVLPKEDPSLAFGKHDGHWNPRAHKLITEQLISQLEQKNRPGIEDE